MPDNRHYLSSLFDPAVVGVLSEVEPRKQPELQAMIAALEAVYGEVPTWSLPARPGSTPLARVPTPGGGSTPRAPEPAAADPGAAGRASAQDLLVVVRLHDPTRIDEAIVFAAQRGARAMLALEGRCDDVDRARCQALARRAGIRLLGPVSLGLIRPAAGLNLGRIGATPNAGNVALISQSGAMAAAIMDWSAGTLIGFSLVLATGAEVDVDLADVLDFLASDVRTKSVVLYLEAVRDARKFMSALRALATVKPVVIMRGARRNNRRLDVSTHSGALLGADAVYSAALRRCGAVELRLFTQMFTSARYLASARWPLGRRIALVSNGNGPAQLAADQAWYQGLDMEALTDASVQALGECLPQVVADNPLVLGIDATPLAHEQAIGIVAADAHVDGILVMHSPVVGIDSEGVAAAVAAAGARARKPVFTCWLGGNAVVPQREVLDEAGLPSFSTPESAVDAFATVVGFYQNQKLLQEVAQSLSGLEAPDLGRARSLIEAARADGRDTLTDIEAMQLLAAFHIPLAPLVLARDADEAAAHAKVLGYPVVLKICSPDIVHKNEVGGVILDVRSQAELHRQVAALLTRVRSMRPEARIDGISVQRMVTARGGLEAYFGVLHDEVFGPVVAFGSGGTAVERTADSTIGFPPLNRFLADRVIDRTRIGAEIRRRRDAWPAAMLAVERILVRISEMVCELPQILAMDVNPVILDAAGAVAVDARIVLDLRARVRPGSYDHMAILPYPTHLVSEETLADGQVYQLRPIRPEDGTALQSFVRGLSDRSRYFRFISALSELPPRMLARYTQVDYHREIALVAVLRPRDLPGERRPGGDGQIIGVVRYLLNPDGETCEFAIAIADECQGKGLGTRLMRAIVEAARDRGLRRVDGYVLGENRPMLALMKAAGFQIAADPEDPTMRLVWFDLA